MSLLMSARSPQTCGTEGRTGIVILHELRELFLRAFFGLRFGVYLAFFDQPGSEFLCLIVYTVGGHGQMGRRLSGNSKY